MLGATLKATRMWWIGQVTVRVMVVERVISTRPVREKAHHGAEKSRTNLVRRKRGLRKGGRARQRSLSPNRQPLHENSQQSVAPLRGLRKVNHRRRPERWLIAASERLRGDAQRFVKMSRSGISPEVRRSCKQHCLAKWLRLQRRATELGFPPKLAFDTTFFRWLDKEFPWEVGRMDMHALLFSKNPFAAYDPPEDDRTRDLGPQFPPPEVLTVNRRGRGARRLPVERNRTCRMCGYIGPGPHSFGSCRVSGDSTRQRGGAGARRRCGCLRGARCPH